MEERIENELDRLGCEPKWRSRYWLIKCPKHEDKSPSAQCFPDGWIECHAGCGRFHINQLVGKTVVNNFSNSTKTEYKPKEEEEKIVRGDFTDMWTELDLLTMPVKGVPASVLNELGWRKFDSCMGYQEGVFIPYFDVTGKVVPFFQIRHNPGSQRRFTFAKDITPICYGLECLKYMKDFLCFTEGSRDSVILRMAGIPAIAIPSASSGKMLVRMGIWARKHNLMPVAICDKDKAGEMLLEALNNASVAFLDDRTTVGKDVGDLYAQNGLESVREHYKRYIVKEGLVGR